jgi:hypothetical protein
VIIQPGGAPSQHDPNEALDQISADNLTLHKTKMKPLALLAGQGINVKRSAGLARPNVLVFHHATSMTNSTMSRIPSSGLQSLR